MDKITPVVVPKETVSDDAYIVVDLRVTNGEKVSKGQILGSVETSKAVIDLEAPASGFVHFRIREEDLVGVGELFAIISNSPKLSTKHDERLKRKGRSDRRAEMHMSGSEPRISKSALEMIRKNKLDLSAFGTKKLITQKDVEAYLQDKRPQGKTEVSFQINPETVAQSIVILGGGGHAKMCIDLLRQSKEYEILGIVASDLDARDSVLGVPVLGTEEALESLYERGVRNVVNGVGAATDHPVREKLFRMLKRIGFVCPNLVHPKSVIEPSATLGKGNQIMAGAVIGSEVSIGDNCIVNSGSVVSHDCRLDDNVHVAPGAILAGNVSIGENTLIGMGATIYLNVTIGRNAVIYNGMNVHKNIPDNTIVKTGHHQQREA